MMKELSLCDVHHHYNPLLMSGNKRNTIWKVPEGFLQEQSIGRNLGMMTECGIRKSILSYPVWFPELTESGRNDMCRCINEEYAVLSDRHPSLEAFATLPFSCNHDLILREMEHALDVLHLKGVLLPSNFQEICPNRDVLWELYSELNRRKAIVFIHPMFSSPGERRMEQNAHSIMKEMTRAACELLFNKSAKLYPKIRFILSYGGGNISFFFHRIKSETLYPDLENGSEEEGSSGIEDAFRLLYYDTAFPTQANLLNWLRGFAPKSHLLYGSDFPSHPVQSVIQNLQYLNHSQCENGENLLECLQTNSSMFGDSQTAPILSIH